MRLAVTAAGAFNVATPSATSYTAVSLPTGVTALASPRLPVFARYRDKTIIVGPYNRPTVWTKYHTLHGLGIYPPWKKPTLAAGTSSGGSTAVAIGYLTFVQKINEQVVHESGPSAASASFTATGSGFAWSNLPTTSVDARVTHIRGYRSMGGALPRQAWERTIGASSVTENVATGSLGQALPTKRGLDGATELDENARGVVPHCRLVETYHDAAWYVLSDYPNRVYPSKLFEVESVNLDETDKTYLETLDGEPITGLRKHGDELIVLCPTSSYSIQGYGQGDYSIRKISDFFGSISHHGGIVVGPNGELWFPSTEGVCAYYGGGNFKNLMDGSLRDYWIDDYKDNRSRYEQCFAGYSRMRQAYMLVIPQADSSTFRYVGYYSRPNYGEWTTDIMTRQTASMGVYMDGMREITINGGCDGYARQEDVVTNADDDSDSYAKALTITHPHLFFGDQGGKDSQGRTIAEMDVFVKNANSAVTVSLYGGDETAIDSTSAQWTQAIAASALSGYVGKTSFNYPVNSALGKGLTVKITGSSPNQVSYRGMGVHYREGAQARPAGS